ncbi:MAG: ABC transporter ATP-binding protein [Kiritimatiellae bacterium]|nr:ABC transporter ATP-binding protein [Kiritimatiellia bacterium]
MIRARNLTRKFHRRIAVEDLNFGVERGEIVGFLGPNGAGKTTTMRMLTGFIPPTDGEAIVAGFSVARDPLETRRRIGYLPEHCPLYPEMRVDEFLRYRAAIKGLSGAGIRARVSAVTEQCGLGEVRRRIIGQLSKGFRQRVGLADALVHEPELLILDEPTIGLDPNQIRQVRELIRSLAGNHTVLISTHILSEVEQICRRVLIMNKGRLVASDSTERLRMLRGGRVTAQIRAPADALREELGSLGAVGWSCAEREDGWMDIAFNEAAEGADACEETARRAAARGWPLRALGREHGSLEDIFVALTSEPREPTP